MNLRSSQEPRALTRCCATCGSTRGTLLFAQRFARIEGVSIHGGYDVVACSACGLCFADGVPEQSAFDRYYREASKYEASGPGEIPEHAQQRFRDEVRDIVSHLRSRDAAIFEIGCATGALLGMLRELGYANVSGLDPSPACAVTALERHGVRIQTGEMSQGLQGRHDLIVMIAVLEHVRDLGSTLSMLRNALADDGLLFLEMPDATRFERGADAPFQEFSVEHINYFSPHSLTQLLTRHGFTAVDVQQRDRPDSNSSIAPVIAGVFRKSKPDAVLPALLPDTGSAEAINAYVIASELRERPLREFVRSALQNAPPVLVWGCGTLTLRLLATGQLLATEVAAFVDGNQRYWGRSIAGIPILPPASIAARSETILVSSIGQAQAIERVIRDKLGYGHRVLAYPRT